LNAIELARELATRKMQTPISADDASVWNDVVVRKNERAASQPLLSQAREAGKGQGALRQMLECPIHSDTLLICMLRFCPLQSSPIEQKTRDPMPGQLRQLGKHTLVYSAGIIIGKVASFVMLPVYTRYLTPADYGVLELLGMTIDVIGMITSIGIVNGVFKFYSDEPDPAGKNAVISTAAISAIALAAATSVIGFTLAPLLTTVIFKGAGTPLYLRLYFVIYLLQTFEYLPLLLIRAENRSVLFVTFNASKLIVTLSLNILFVVFLGMGIEGVLIANIIATTTSATILTIYMVRRVGLRFSREKFKLMVEFGSSVALWSLASFVLVFSDRFFLNYYTNTSIVGIYSLAYKFAFLLSVLAYTPFETVWTVQRFEVAKLPEAQKIFSSVFLYVNVILGGIAVVICLFIRDFLSVMSSPGFLPAYRLVPLLLAAQIVFVWAAYWTTGIYISGRTKTLAKGSIVLVAVTILFNFVLIPPFGAFGAAAATMGAYTARFVWIYYFAQRDYPIRQDWSGIVKLYMVLTASVALGFAFRPATLPLSIAWSTLLLVVCIYLVFVAVLSAADRAGLRALIENFLSRRREQQAA
jgi:O-antigen/teichoic acid export membrane protein